MRNTSLLLALALFAGCEPSPALAQATYASYYTTESCQKEGTSGVWTASGERYDEAAMTCALPSRCFGCKVRVTSVRTGKSVILVHQDFGPGKKAIARNVIIDITPAAFLALGHKLEEGRIEVRVEPEQRTAVASQRRSN